MANTPPPRGAATGGRPGANKAKTFGATFSPGLNINVNAGNKTTSGGVPAQGGRGGGAHPATVLPDPEFNSPSEIRQYCNALRALATGLSFELSMASEILSVTLQQVPDPDGKPFGSRLRARRVSRKLAKSADAFKAAAVNAAATYAAFQQEFQGEINAVRHRARPRPTARRIDWADQ